MARFVTRLCRKGVEPLDMEEAPDIAGERMLDARDVGLLEAVARIYSFENHGWYISLITVALTILCVRARPSRPYSHRPTTCPRARAGSK